MMRQASLGTPKLGMMTLQCLPCGPSGRHDEQFGWLSCSIKANGRAFVANSQQHASNRQMAFDELLVNVWQVVK